MTENTRGPRKCNLDNLDLLLMGGCWRVLGLKIPRGNKWQQRTAVQCTMFAHFEARMRQYGSWHPAVLSATESIGREQESINRVLAAV